MTISRMGAAILVALLSKPGVAADVAFNAYLEFPLGGGSPFFGLRASPDTGIYPGASDNAIETPRMDLEIRYGAERSLAFLINGFPIPRSLMLNVSDDGESQATENGFDWRWVGAAALGVGVVIVATQIDFGDTSLNACSGTNCPPEEDPPEETEPSNAFKENWRSFH